jgi:hypothetical protein
VLDKPALAGATENAVVMGAESAEVGSGPVAGVKAGLLGQLA